MFWDDAMCVQGLGCCSGLVVGVLLLPQPRESCPHSTRWRYLQRELLSCAALAAPSMICGIKTSTARLTNKIVLLFFSTIDLYENFEDTGTEFVGIDGTSAKFTYKS